MNKCESGHCDVGAPYGSEDSCGISGGGCGCSCHSKSSSCCDKADAFLHLAKSAHHELLKQKMKAVFEAKIGKKMDKVAELVVNTALIYMQDKMTEKQTGDQYEQKLMEIFKR